MYFSIVLTEVLLPILITMNSGIKQHRMHPMKLFLLFVFLFLLTLTSEFTLKQGDFFCLFCSLRNGPFFHTKKMNAQKKAGPH